jgi:hypothetical protein
LCTSEKETYYYLSRKERFGEMLFAARPETEFDPEIELAEANVLAGGVSPDTIA